ncbi:MAG: PP2C family protein-serine/threonine phosphatase [Mycobacteriales bacterium]
MNPTRVIAAGWRRLGPAGHGATLLAIAVALVLPSFRWPHQSAPVTALTVVLVIAGIVLGSTAEFVVVAVGTAVLAAIALAVLRHDIGVNGAQIGLWLIVASWAVFVVRRRGRLGLGPQRAETMLLDLRAQLLAHGVIPELPDGWHADAELRPANDAVFAGDFLVTRRGVADDVDLIDVVLVDVSGRGADAGARALLFAGALGALVGGPTDELFLSEANRYLCRQGWENGFATAVYLRMTLSTGDFAIWSAGHLPAVILDGQRGRWEVATARGPLLGVATDAEFSAHRGRLESGDGLILYTDGVMEAASRDVDVSVDRLLGFADDLVVRLGFDGAAERLINAVPERTDDDRSVVLLWRDG